ncbi:MAG: MFS transporter, partial [Mycobacteriales bacterium]
LDGDHYVVGHSLANITSQFMQVVGFVVGGAIVAALGTRVTLLLDAATFVVSALLVVAAVHPRPAAAAGRPMLLHDLAEGSRQVFGDRLLRSILILAWAGASFAVVPEGLAVAYAKSIGHGPVATGILTAAGPAGAALGLFVVGRFLSPPRRRELMLPLAAASFVALLPTALHPPFLVATGLWVLCGAGTAFQLAANATFVAAVPASIRGRAFGIAQSGLQVGQGLTIAGAGALALVMPVHIVVALSGVVGLVAVALLRTRWPYAEMDAVHAPGDAMTPIWTAPYLLRGHQRELRGRLRLLPTGGSGGGGHAEGRVDRR